MATAETGSHGFCTILSSVWHGFFEGLELSRYYMFTNIEGLGTISLLDCV